MNRTCRVQGCDQPASSQFSAHCRRHKTRLRRHGAVDQTGVTKAELAPFVGRVLARIAKNHESPLWGQLDDRWGILVEDSRAAVAAAASGRPGSRHQRNAAGIVAKLAGESQPREIVVTALAMYVLKVERPDRFKNEQAFRAQTVRRVMSLGSRHIAKRYDHNTGGQRLIYRETSPRGVAVLGQWLAVSLGAAGLRLGGLEERDRETQQGERDAVRVSLAELA